MTLRRQPLYQQVYAELRSQLATGRMRLGSRLDIQELADQLEVSRTPVREAIRQLIQDGLVDVDREGRASVHSPSPQDLAEIYVVRASLEAMAARMVAIRMPEVDIAPLEEAVESVRRANAEGDLTGVAAANSAFHQHLIRLSENAAIDRILDTFKIRTTSHRQISMQFDERRKASLSAHADTVKLLKKRDPDAVEARVKQEILDAGRFAVRMYQSDPAEDTPSMRFLRDG